MDELSGEGNASIPQNGHKEGLGSTADSLPSRVDIEQLGHGVYVGQRGCLGLCH